MERKKGKKEIKEQEKEKLNFIGKLKKWAKELKRELFALYFAYQHPKTPFFAKILAIITVCYAFSPIDLIPDFIPILGYLDDLLLVPLGIYISIKMIGKEIMKECRKKADELPREERKKPFLRYFTLIFILIFYMFFFYKTFQLLSHFGYLKYFKQYRYCILDDYFCVILLAI